MKRAKQLPSSPPILHAQEKHVVAAKQLLGQTLELTQFVSGLMDDIGNLKAMLQAMSIGEST